MRLIQLAQQVQRTPARFGSNALGIRKKEDGLTLRSELHSLIPSGKKSATPAGLPSIRLVLASEHKLETQLVELRGRPRNEKKHDAFGFTPKMQRRARYRIPGHIRQGAPVQQRAQRQRADAEAGLMKEMPPRLQLKLVLSR